MHAGSLPIIDIHANGAAEAIDRACRTVGFFAIGNHGIDDQERSRLLEASAEFFALPTAVKGRVSLAHGGPAWRGWFALGEELTSGKPDLKEGYYFGTDLPPDRRPLHGPNIWPENPAGLRELVNDWMSRMEALGQQVLSLMAVGLGLDDDFFANSLTRTPTALFRIFRYPPQPTMDADPGRECWGVAEHSDYGLLTLLAHDGSAGLEVNVDGEWIAAPSDPSLIICNLGDMLDRLTRGRYRSTPHRVRNQATHDRYSFPFFLDPGWDAVIEPLPVDDEFVTPADAAARWDGTNLQQISGTYGEWLWAKVSKVFPALAASVAEPIAYEPSADGMQGCGLAPVDR